jgi:hypothetical protein
MIKTLHNFKTVEITAINKNKALITTISHDHKKNPQGMGAITLRNNKR